MNKPLDLGQRMRDAREAAGLSTREAAAGLCARGFRISHASIANYELRRTIPTAALTRTLAQIYRCSQDWLFGKDEIRCLRFDSPRYRCLKSVRVGEKRAYETEARKLAAAYLFVVEVLQRTVRAHTLRVTSACSGKEVAARIRDELNLDDHPIPSLVRLLTEFGIFAIAVDTPSRIDGFAAKIGRIPFVVLNTSVPTDRLRLNAAHELAHHLFDDTATRGELTDKEIEKRAFECASHLLMPDAVLKRAFELRSMVRLVEFKMRFGISLAAMVYRAKEAKLLTAREYEHMWREFSRLGWRKQEPGLVAPDRPTRLEALIDAAVRDRKTTYEEIAEHAGLEDVDLRERVFVATGGSHQEFPSDVSEPILRLRQDGEP